MNQQTNVGSSIAEAVWTSRRQKLWSIQKPDRKIFAQTSVSKGGSKVTEVGLKVTTEEDGRADADAWIGGLKLEGCWLG